MQNLGLARFCTEFTEPTTITTVININKPVSPIDHQEGKMKFKCNQQELNKAINTVSKAVSSRTTIPVLKGILITATGDQLILTSSNLDMSIRKTIDAVVDEEGSAVVVAKLFGEIIRKLPSETVFIEEDGPESLNISTSSSSFRVLTLPAEEFPEMGKKADDDKVMVFDTQLFKNMVRQTAFAASIDESKGVLTGILTEMSEDKITMVALDGFRLALANEEMKNEEDRKFIISAKIMNEIARIIAEEDQDDSMQLYLGEKRAVIYTGRTEIALRIMEGEFIDYRRIIPTDSTTKLIVNRELFMDSIERASLLAREGKNNLVKVSVKDDMMTITSRSEEGDVREELAVDKEGNDIEIGFNSKYVMDVIKEIADETVTLNMKSSVTPCVVRPVEGNSYEYLILPVRIPSM